MKIAIICVGVVTLRFRTVPPHGSSNKTRVNRAMPHHRIPLCMLICKSERTIVKLFAVLVKLHRFKNQITYTFCKSACIFSCSAKRFVKVHTRFVIILAFFAIVESRFGIA